MYDMSVDVAYVGAKGTGGYAALDINAPTVARHGQPGTAVLQSRTHHPINSWGARLKTNYQSLQVSLNKPFTHGLMLKGAYTLSKSQNESDNDGRATLNWNTPSEDYRNYALAGFDRTHNFQMGFAYALPWQSKGGYDNVLSAIVNDWQVNGLLAAFSGTPFTVRPAAQPEYAEQHADGRSRWLLQCDTARLARPGPGSIPPQFAQPTGVRFGNTGRNQFRGPGGWNLDFSAVPVVPDRRCEAARIPAPGGQPVQPSGLRQPERGHHLRQLRANHEHREPVSGAPDPDGPPVLVLIADHVNGPNG